MKITIFGFSNSDEIKRQIREITKLSQTVKSVHIINWQHSFDKITAFDLGIQNNIICKYLTDGGLNGVAGVIVNDSEIYIRSKPEFVIPIFIHEISHLSYKTPDNELPNELPIHHYAANFIKTNFPNSNWLFYYIEVMKIIAEGNNIHWTIPAKQFISENLEQSKNIA